MKGKAVLVTGIYSPDIGGPATYIPRMASSLRQKGFMVTTISLTDSPNIVRKAEDWDRKFVIRRQNKVTRAYRVVLELVRNSRDAQVVLANGLFEEVGIASLLIKKNLVAKIVGDPVWERYSNVHGREISLENFNSGFKLPLKFRLQRFLLKECLNRFSAIYCPSDQLASIVQGWGVRTPISTIENGIQCEQRSPVPFSDRCGVVSVSRLVSWKNVDILVQACAKANLPLTIIGDGPEKNSLVTLSKTLGHNVKFLGELQPDDVNNLMRTSRIFALVSSYEGLSFSLLEAMNNSVPVVVSDCLGNTKVIQNEISGLVVPMLSIDELTRQLLRLYGDEPLQLKLSQKAQNQISELFCEENQLDKVFRLMKIEP